MRRRVELLAAFGLALAVHILLAGLAGRLLRPAAGLLVPEFMEGRSALAVSFVPVRPPEAIEPVAEPVEVAPEPEPEPEPVVEPIPPEQPEPPPEPEPVVVAPDEEAVEVPQAAEPEAPEEVAPPVPEVKEAEPLPEEPVEEAPAGAADEPAMPAAEEGEPDEGMEDPEGGAASEGVAGAIVPGSAIRPRYPLGSRLRGEEGVVTIGATVDRRGRARDVDVVRSSGYRALDAAAVRAVEEARFAAPDPRLPADRRRVALTFRFRLTE